jgi:hypothetical protein
MLLLRRCEPSRRCPMPDHADVVRLLSDAQDLPVNLADLDTD